MWEGLIAGMAVAGLNGLVAWLILRWAFDKSMMSFMKGVMGGMVGRLFLMGIASFLVLTFTAVDRVAYFAALMAVYLLFQIVEIVFILRKTKKSKEVETPHPVP